MIKRKSTNNDLQNIHIKCTFYFELVYVFQLMYNYNEGLGFGFMVFNATFNNISVISWRSVLLVEETGVPEENHLPVASHWQILSHNVVSIEYSSPWMALKLTTHAQIIVNPITMRSQPRR